MTPDYFKVLERCQVATVVAAMFKRGLRSRFFSGLSPIGPIDKVIVGEAFTIRAIPVREDMRAATASRSAPNTHRQSLAAAPDGKVIVFEGRGMTDVSPLGDLIALSLVRRGMKAFITDAGINDTQGINKAGLPVYAAGPAGIPGSGRIQVVDWNVPIGLGDVAVFPGDIVIADAMGAACIPAEIAEEIAADALRQEYMETFIEEELSSGADLETTYPPDQATLEKFEDWIKTNKT